MNNNTFLENINDIDDELIEEAETEGKIKKFASVKFIAAAALIALCILAVRGISDRAEIKPKYDESAEIKNEIQSIEAIAEAETQSSEQDDTEASAGTENNLSSDALHKESVSTDNAVNDETKSGPAPSKPEFADDNSVNPDSANDKTKGAVPASAKPKPTDGNSGNPDSESVDQHGNFFRPVIPKNNIKTSGEKLTDHEAASYFEENKAHIINLLTASGVPSENIEIKQRGYCHLSYDGTSVEHFDLKQNFRDYLVYNGNELVAIITLYKENGNIYSTPAFGAPWFKDYSSFLNRHKGQKLVYVYGGPVEFIITPDNKAYNFQGYDMSYCIDAIKEPYNYFYCENAVYIP